VGSARLDAIIGSLRDGGLRITAQRRAILDALVASDGHPTAEQLTAAVQAAHPDVNGSTVYRFLEELEQRGVVDHVHLGHGPAVYHFADDRHHHLVCDRCGHVAELPDDVLRPLRRRLRDEFGFDVEPRHFALVGRCVGCAGGE
jgi:Fe2+ or Zn2+ uptake regulation protein